MRSKHSPHPSGYMQVYYHKKRGEILALLGGRCADCGSIFDLEINHINGYDGKLSPNNSRGGMRNLNHAIKLIKEGRSNELNLLCKTCNLIDRDLKNGNGGK